VTQAKISGSRSIVKGNALSGYFPEDFILDARRLAQPSKIRICRQTRITLTAVSKGLCYAIDRLMAYFMFCILLSRQPISSYLVAS
jgi:hypothetical protein